MRTLPAVPRAAAFTLALAPLLALTFTSPAAADPGGRPITVAMTGAEEAPNPGDPDASGTARFTLNQGRGMVCFDLGWADVDGTVTAAHIHRAPAGAPGPVVVPLFSGAYAGTDTASGCAAASAALVKEIRKDPAAFYVNVHSVPDYPGGAVRGQLG